MSFFKYGDRVIVSGHKATVISVYTNIDGDYFCKVRFEDKNLIPNEMDYPDSFLKFDFDYHEHDYFFGGYYPKRRKPPIDVEKFCPECGTPWTQTKFNNKIWYDCGKCKKKKEELVK